MRRLRFAAIIGAAVVAISCSNAADYQLQPQGLAHIHGLGVNPADQNLYAGTHYGVYRIAADRAPELVGDLVQDFMGFTVIGPDHFLGSGHPGADSHDASPQLGLIESTDAGHSWNTLSLDGTADFHALEYRHNRVYGHDSQTGQILISSDKRSWDRRAVIPAVDLALSPYGPDDILAATTDGLTRSRDGAATFTAVPNAPPLAYLSWPDTGPLIGVDSSGTLYASDDSGATWSTRHTLAQRPEALLAAGNGQVFIATRTMIFRSTDNAASVEPFRTLD